ncbi:hypothetical protein JFL43_20870 [Viridibacillus sp. YIM B01967]|uniref:Uncharacterized protein n=1 Tax=Viridibacillus soli TaxID=2798301 RepID=A0ABS1HCU0_9BACL|nr:hypothetical protein [Viridibacillus soli]MBK3497233.1 hypothetical protein [Viridibacillus soli]
MIDLFQVLKELEVPAIESKVFVQPLDGSSNFLSGYQQELDLEIAVPLEKQNLNE